MQPPVVRTEAVPRVSARWELATSAYVTDVVPRARYGAAHGVFGTIYDIGDAAGPMLAGLLVAAWGYAQMFQAMAMLAMTVAAAFYVLSGSPGPPGRAVAD